MRTSRSLALIVAGIFALGCMTQAGSTQEAPKPSPAVPQGLLPKFRDYPAAAIYKGRPARFRPKSSYERDRRELYAGTADEGVTFAGHYTVIKNPCGSTCIAPDILDLRTGRTLAPLFTVSGWREVHDDFEAVETRPNSRLIVFLGARNEKPPLGYHYYVLENGKLRFLRTVSNDGNFLEPLTKD